jgi:hypothetical protein
MIMKLILSASILALLAGCTDGGADAELKYDGAANGSHSDAAKCDDEGTIKGSGSIPDGEVLVTLKDSAGKTLLSQTFKGDFTLDPVAVSGASGSWSFDAARSGDDVVGDSFSGDYAFYVNC